MELLSPAGNYDSAIAAINGGADALYLGGKLFSARMAGANFSDEEMVNIIKYAHRRQVKVYVTINTLIYQDEFNECVKFALFLYQHKVDGLIIQDLGLAHYLHIVEPDLVLHASTQLNCHNEAQAKALANIGFKRIVVARESNLSLIKKIKAMGLEVEVFVQGALCVCYSGNCLMSSFIGGRSGNRGRCAQPCRMAYSLYKDGEKISEEKYFISPRDLMTLDYIKALDDANIDSLKIEGRLKANTYTYMTTLAYRHALDALKEHRENINLNEDKSTLEKIFSRKFTKGYLFDESPFKLLNQNSSSHQGEVIGRVIKVYKNSTFIKLSKQIHRLDGIRFNNKEQFGLTIEKMFIKGEDKDIGQINDIIEIKGIKNYLPVNNCEVIRTSNYLLNKSLDEAMLKERKIPLKGKLYAYINKPLTLEFTYLNKLIRVQGGLVSEANGNGTDKERIALQLAKSGEYPYYFEDVQIETQGKIFVPISSLNEIRNAAYEKIYALYDGINELHNYPYKDDYQPSKEQFEIRYMTSEAKLVQYLPEDTYTPFNDKHYLGSRVETNPTFKEGMICNYVAEDNSNSLIASLYCNITNSYALDCYYSLGFKQCMLSGELDEDSINALIKDYTSRHQGNNPDVGYLIYGRIDLMVMKSCPIGTYLNKEKLHCNTCHEGNYCLNDRMNVKFPLSGDKYCNSHILNAYPLYLIDRIQKLKSMGFSSLYLVLTKENESEINQILQNVNDNLTGENSLMSDAYTRGHFPHRAL